MRRGATGRRGVRRLAAWLLAACAAATAAGADVLAAQDHAPVVDGAVAAGEYGLTLQYDGMEVALALAGDALHVAAVAATSGWVGVGFGSDVMDGARILFGFVDADGQVFFAEQVGRRHRHHDVTDTVVRAHAVAEADGVTTLEAALPAAFVRAAADAAGTFPMIMAYGRRDSARVVHRFFESIEVTLG